MGKMKELFIQYQEEKDNLDYVDYMHYVECDLADDEYGLKTDAQDTKSHTNDTDSILQFFDKISEN